MNTRINIYLITNLIDNKKYIGITQRKILSRWFEHLRHVKYGCSNSLLHRAIRKYGSQNFITQQIATALTWEAACETEKVLISQYHTFRPNGYNMTLGGEGGYGAVLTEEHKLAISARFKGCKQSKEHLEKLSAVRRGKVRSEESKKKTSASLKRFYATDTQVRARISETSRGRKQSEETIIKRLTKRGAYRHSEETRRKMKEIQQRLALNPERNQKIRLARLGTKASFQTRAKLSLIRKGGRVSPETRQCMSVAAKKREQTKRELRNIQLQPRRVA